MPSRTDTEYVILTVFLIGIVSAIYYLISILTKEADSSLILERTILVGIIISILIILAIILLKDMELKDQLEALKGAGVSKAAGKRTAKAVKKEIMRMYRDMGALKIVLKDGIIDPETYTREKRELDQKVKTLKKEYEKLTK
jgi:hypothetical protein